MSAAAVRTILQSYKFQWSLKGDWARRLAYTSLYWWLYLYGKRVKGKTGPFEAHSYALEYLGRTGRTAARVRFRLPNGLRLETDAFTCFMIVKELYADGIYEFDDRRLPEAGQTVLDVGGQQGVFSTLAAQRIGPKGRLVAVEPDPTNFSLLQKNLSANGFSHAAAVPLALSDKPGAATLHQSSLNTGSHSLVDQGQKGGGVTVEVATLDSLARRLDLAPDLIKIDVEGLAVQVLKGGLETISKYRPWIALEVDQPRDVDEVKSLLEPLGYRFQARDNNLFARPSADKSRPAGTTRP